MSDSVKVSILTVCKNSVATIERTLQAVASQTYSDIEYIIVDGDSQDGTQAVIERYSQYVTRLISEPDEGIYQAMNKGIHQATGEFIYFANSDDYLFDAEVIHDLVQFVQAHPECDLVYGDHEARFTSGDAAIYHPVMPENMLAEMICLGDDHLHQPTSFFRASLFQRVGLFNESYRIASDYEWFLRFLQDPTLKLAYCPRPIVSYAHGGASGNINALFTEVFAIQNQDPLCQQPEWLVKRLDKLQTMFVDKYDLLERTNTLSLARLKLIEDLEANVKTLEERLTQPKAKQIAQSLVQLETEKADLQTQVADLQARIAAMETSKFWQLRRLWFRLKRLLGCRAE